MFPLMGIETEYGLSVAGKGPEYLASETATFLHALPFQSFSNWDTATENPLQDLRGFRVRGLTADPRDVEYDTKGQPPASSQPVKINLALINGARLYNDHGHPEYSTPECMHISDIVAHDRAGETILLACAENLRRLDDDVKVELYKNNTDFHGFSYGCHENYLLPRQREPEVLLLALLPFLVTRQIYAGAGKVGVENSQEQLRADGLPIYQLSQRADYFATLMGVDTLYHRPIINTRDEPHADPALYMRLHVIVGDANRSQFALALKMGVTSLVLQLLADGWVPPIEIDDPVRAIKQISWDQKRRWVVETKKNGTISAIDIQRIYLKAIRDRALQTDSEGEWILRSWEKTLDDLEIDPMRLYDRLDWPAKSRLLNTFLDNGGASDIATLQSLDLEYHNLDPDQSLFAPLERDGEMYRIVTDEAIEEAVTTPPFGTRAAIRGEAVRRFRNDLQTLSWSQIRMTSGGIDLSRLVTGSLADLTRLLQDTTTSNEFIDTVRRWQDENCHTSGDAIYAQNTA